MLHPLRFKPQYKHVIWGGTRIAKFKGVNFGTHTHVGESWELSDLPGHESVVAEGRYAGRTINEMISEFGSRLVGSRVMYQFKGKLPFILKILDAHLDLSVQVHPNDEMANRLYGINGKNEMWYVVEAQPDAQLGIGFNKDYSIEEVAECIKGGTIEDVIQFYKSMSGDIYDIPAGTIHTLGAGNLVVEVQQASDLTYRIWDYNRVDADGKKRELHIEHALKALNTCAGNYKLCNDSMREMDSIANRNNNGYSVYVDVINNELRIHNEDSRCYTFFAIERALDFRIDDSYYSLPQGSCILIPAETPVIELLKSNARYLMIVI